MTEFIINSEQLEKVIRAVENERPINRVIVEGFELPEIVRCRDCAYSIADGNGCGRWRDFIEVEPDGFCAWGELMGDAE